jgi:hypothetical protein
LPWLGRERNIQARSAAYEGLIKEIRDEAYRNNAVLLVRVIPSPFQVYPDVYDHMLTGAYPGNKAVAIT